jgi:hypothetical protein
VVTVTISFRRESVPEEADRADVRRRYDEVLSAVASGTMAACPTDADA